MTEATPLIRPNGQRITDREVQRGLRLNYLAGALGMAFIAVAYGMPLTMFFEALGASGVAIGLVGTINNVALAAQLPGAWLTQRMAARKPFWGATAMSHRLIWLFPIVFVLVLPGQPQAVATLTIAVIVLSAVLANIGAASWYSWMADLVPETKRGRFWGDARAL